MKGIYNKCNNKVIQHDCDMEKFTFELVRNHENNKKVYENV
jgi:hypothetical protein